MSTTIKQTIVELFKLDQMPSEKAAEMVDRLGKMVFQAVLVRTVPLLSDEDMVEYEKIVASENGGEMLFKFLGEKFPNLESIIAEESEALRAELAGEFKSVGL